MNRIDKRAMRKILTIKKLLPVLFLVAAVTMISVYVLGHYSSPKKVAPSRPVLTKELTDIQHVVVGGKDLYIPKAYTHFSYTTIGTKSALIQAFYPGDVPVLDDPNELWRHGEGDGNIRILFSRQEKWPPRAVLEGQIALAKAYKNVGEQYSAIHLTQNKKENWWKNDLWVEDDLKGFFVSCTEKQAETSVPQCSHTFYYDGFYFDISYAKKNLPDWKLIKTNVLKLYNSFKTPQTALAYIQKFTSGNIQGE